MFGNKRAILTAIWDAVDIESGVTELRAALIEARDEPGCQIDLIVDFDLQLLEQAGEVLETARAAGNPDPELRSLIQEGRRRGQRGREGVMREWDLESTLRAGFTLEEAIDIFTVMGTPERYSLMLTETGWTIERYSNWLNRTIRELILSEVSH